MPGRPFREIGVPTLVKAIIPIHHLSSPDVRHFQERRLTSRPNSWISDAY